MQICKNCEDLRNRLKASFECDKQKIRHEIRVAKNKIARPSNLYTNDYYKVKQRALMGDMECVEAIVYLFDNLINVLKREDVI